MTPAEQKKLLDKILAVRQLELRGDTEGERAAATVALNRLFEKWPKPIADPEGARRELDAIGAGEIDPIRRVPQPQPFPGGVQVVIIQGSMGFPPGFGWGVTGSSASAATTTNGFVW